jgi:hypothetical protein
MTAFAFQCQDCGHLEEGPFAGTRPFPSNCRHCDIGSHLETREELVDALPDRILAARADALARYAEDRDHAALGATMSDLDAQAAGPGEWVSVPTTIQVIDRPNRFTILADLSEAEQADILATRADPGDTIVRYIPTTP